MIEREKKRARLVNRYAAKRAELKEIAKDESLQWRSIQSAFETGKLPRNQQLIVCTTVVN